MTNPRHIELPYRNVRVDYRGWHSDLNSLRTHGWQVKFIYNFYTEKISLQLRGPNGWYGKATFGPTIPRHDVTLDFMLVERNGKLNLVERNGKLNPAPIEIDRKDAISLKGMRFTDSDIGALLDLICALQAPKDKERLRGSDLPEDSAQEIERYLEDSNVVELFGT
jgi:hypothetical protein